MKTCIVLMCNNNKYYINEFFRTIKELREIGKYVNDIVLIYNDELNDIINGDVRFNENKYNIIYKYFPEIDRTSFLEIYKNKPFLEGDKREITKTFQYHKFYVFDIYFKNWDKIFYIDVGMHIMKPIQKMLDIECNIYLLAHADQYPYMKQKLDCQFEKSNYNDLYNELKKEYNTNINYFQTGILLFNSCIIKENTVNELIKLSEKFYNSLTNEQGIMNLYFNSKLNIWRQIQLNNAETFYYDMWERPGKTYRNYIMLKRIRFPNK